MPERSYHFGNIRALLTEGFSVEELRRLCFEVSEFRPVYEQLAQNSGKAEIVDCLIGYAERQMKFEPLLDWARKHNPSRYEKHQPYYDDTSLPIAKTEPIHIFIAYKQHTKPDHLLAKYLYDVLSDQGHLVFLDTTMRTGDPWLEQIDQEIKASDFMIVLLSETSASSEMLQAEVRRAYDYRKDNGKPQTLPIRISYEGRLPYPIEAFIGPIQYIVWRDHPSNTDQLIRQIADIISGKSPAQPFASSAAFQSYHEIGVDGTPITSDRDELHAPLPQFDPRFLRQLETPGGAVKLRDKLYIEREADYELKREVLKWGTTTTIKAPRQMGKTSLLVRAAHWGSDNGGKVAFLDFESFGHDKLTSLDTFLKEFGQLLCQELRLDASPLENMWKGTLGAPNKLTYFIEDHLLPNFEVPIVLAIDEADCLLQTPFYQDFFGLVRAWHNRRAKYEQWEKLNIVLIISTEPYLLIKDINQSPFNVGLRVELEDFNEAQVSDLNQRHGLPVTESDFPSLIRLLNGHPYLTRKALFAMVTESLTWHNLTQIATLRKGPFGDHLARHQWVLQNEPELKAALKAIIQSSRCLDETSFYRLLRAGLVKGNADNCVCRCELYGRYFREIL